MVFPAVKMVWEPSPMEKCSVYDDCEKEALRYKWIQSEKAGHDLGEAALREWVRHHWWGYLRARWVEHLQGIRFWVELDRGDFGLLERIVPDDQFLMDRILDRIKAGWENLDIIIWAQDWGLPIQRVLKSLEILDINSRRLAHRFDSRCLLPSTPLSLPDIMPACGSWLLTTPRIICASAAGSARGRCG